MRLWVNTGFVLVIGIVLFGTDILTQKSRAAEDGVGTFDVTAYVETINARLSKQTAKTQHTMARNTQPVGEATADLADLFAFLPQDHDGWLASDWSVEAQARLDGSEGTLRDRLSPDRWVGGLTPQGRNSRMYTRGEGIVRLEISRLGIGAAGKSAHLKAMRTAMGVITAEEESFAILQGVNFRLMRRAGDLQTVEALIADHIRIRAQARTSADDLRLLLSAINYGALFKLAVKETGEDEHLKDREMPQVSASRKPAFQGTSVAVKSSHSKKPPKGIIINRGARQSCGSLDKGCSLIRR